MKQEIYKDYMSTIYSAGDREKNIDEEYEHLYFWNRKYILPHITKNKQAKILDVGCGMGQNMYTFKRLGYRDITGLDISLECVDFCKKRDFNVLGVSAEEYLKDKENLFDLVTIYHVVEHIKKEDIIDFLKILKKSLRPGGVLVINIPNGNNAISGCHDRYVDITHEILYTPESMREILFVAGFELKNIIIKELVAYSPDDAKLSRKLLKKIVLPIITSIVDLIWYFFFVSQGAAPKKNRPVLISISKK